MEHGAGWSEMLRLLRGVLREGCRLMDVSEINVLLGNETDLERITILKMLKGLNKKAYLFVKSYRPPFKRGSYTALQKTDIWKHARLLNIEYKKKDGNNYCDYCNGLIKNTIVLHHEVGFYHFVEYFTPSYTMTVHKHCHGVIHGYVRP